MDIERLAGTKLGNYKIERLQEQKEDLRLLIMEIKTQQSKTESVDTKSARNQGSEIGGK